MKINKSVEQAVFVTLMLALQKNHTPVKSGVLSTKLGVSDSYLKKILRQLVVAGLVQSSASKDGGYQLAKSIETITLFDLYEAVESKQFTYTSEELARNLFSNEEHIKQSEQKIINAFNNGFNDFYKQLKLVHLSELLEEGKYENGCIEWDKE
ncbi:RrF2 family transcriptional regulator [Paenibacillus segetis]|uniref:Transcriptional regulator n=1 Tax=Paenibacillus segetis TaxID=1325360 RepID=A0ABQ1YDT5_9BACL|nr:Rrf2 family transcriptional regulator [Paenibacillus segetis]GGH20755.1 transcriptional regulator [Paenibacillus segetis]